MTLLLDQDSRRSLDEQSVTHVFSNQGLILKSKSRRAKYHARSIFVYMNNLCGTLIGLVSLIDRRWPVGDFP